MSNIVTENQAEDSSSYVDAPEVKALIESFVASHIKVSQGLYADSDDLLLALASAAYLVSQNGETKISVEKLFNDYGSAALSRIISRARQLFGDNGGTTTNGNEIFTCIQRPQRKSMLVVNMSLASFPSAQTLTGSYP